MNHPDPFAYVDTDRYPIHRPESPDYDALLRQTRRSLADDGCAVLAGFIRPRGVHVLTAEAERAAPAAHRSFSRTNAYFTQDDPALAPDHPKRRFYARSNAFVPADNFDGSSVLRAIYEWPGFAPFIQDALGEADFHRYADPLADVIVNVVEPGGGFPWHFDTNNYTVTLAIRNGERGGRFEYCPWIRSAEEENFEAVGAVLDGDRGPVRSIELTPGALQIFKGRHSLHRVTPVEGALTRFVAIFSYAERPGVVATPERCRQLYGRVLPIHYQQADRRPDRLLD